MRVLVPSALLEERYVHSSSQAKNQLINYSYSHLLHDYTTKHGIEAMGQVAAAERCMWEDTRGQMGKDTGAHIHPLDGGKTPKPTTIEVP